MAEKMGKHRSGMRADNEESFFVRHAYFRGANVPCSGLKVALKAEINVDA